MNLYNRINQYLIESAKDPDIEHAKALQKTGFWGKAGTGSIFLAKSTGRIGIAHRSRLVEQPGTYGTVGGAIDPRENPKEAAIREVKEELGYQKKPSDNLILLYVFKSGKFKYSNFLYVVEKEFAPKFNWENQGFVWVKFGNWPSPLHFGLAEVLSQSNCLQIIKREIEKGQNVIV